MITDIVLDWNELTITMTAWLTCVGAAVAVDFGPEIYRENKARVRLARSVALLAERRKTEGPVLIPEFTSFHLGVFEIKPMPRRGRHAKI